MNTVTLNVEGMSCGHCISAVEGALKGLEAVGKVDLENKTVQVEFDEGKVSLDSIKNAIEDQGYEVQ
jgi:copper chaperone